MSPAEQYIKRKTSSPRSMNELKKFKLDKGALLTPICPMPPKTPKKQISSSPTNTVSKKIAKQPKSSELELLKCEICKNKYDEQKHLPIIIPDCDGYCCDFCAQKLVSNNSTKFKCLLCQNFHQVPKSKLYELNKFALKILNIRLETNFARPNYSQAAEAEKLLKEQIHRIEKQRLELKEELTEKLFKTEVKLNNFTSKMIEILSGSFTQDYLKDITNEINRGDERLQKEINSMKECFKSSRFTSEPKNISSRFKSVERTLQIVNQKAIKPFDYKNDEKIYIKHFFDRINFLSDEVCLSFEDATKIIESTVYALSEKIIFYCVKDKYELNMKINETKHGNHVLKELKLNEEFQLLKYARVDGKNFFAFFQGIKECCVVKYDMAEFSKPKTMNLKRELIFMSSNEIMLFSSKLDLNMIKIIDTNFSPIESIGQCTDVTMPYYFKDKTFRILGANKQKLVVKHDSDNYLNVYSRINGSLSTKIDLEDDKYDDEDLNRIQVFFTESADLRIIIVSRRFTQVTVLTEAGYCMKQFYFIKSNFDRFSLTTEKSLAFYYEKEKIIQFLRINE